jgi:hypothetical protein
MHANQSVRRALLGIVLGLGGFIASVVVVLNLHILVGLQEGYAASPREVWDKSVLLAAVDVALLVAGPLLATLLVRRSGADPARGGAGSGPAGSGNGGSTRGGSGTDRRRAGNRP